MTTTATNPKIVLDGVTKYFRIERDGREHRLLALSDINLEINENEFLTIIGPSGCGKTTLLRIIDGLVGFDGGQVRVGGKVVTKPGPDRAVVFQSFGLLPWKTVLDNVTFPLGLRKVPKSEARKIARQQLELVGLERFADSYPHQLSGGMQQRVGLARALATDPEILLMDEPFGAIDAQTREVMQEELMRLWSRRRKTVVFITHDLDEAVYLADRILVLTRQPGSVRTIVPVDLPRPRWEYDVRAHPEFLRVRRQIWDMLRHDVLEEEAEQGVSVALAKNGTEARDAAG